MAMVNDMNVDWQVKSKQTTAWAPAWPPQTSAATQTLLRLTQFVCQFDFCNPNINEACNMQMIILTYDNYLLSTFDILTTLKGSSFVFVTVLISPGVGKIQNNDFLILIY